MKRKAVYPGTFDPPTNGHVDIIERGSKVFDKLLVAVAVNPHKKTLFSPDERVTMLKEIVQSYDNIDVVSFSGLLVDFMVSAKADVIVRGLRAISDFEYEFQMAHLNKKLLPEIDTIFMMTGEKFFYVSSNIVKEIASLGGEVNELVDKCVEVKLREAFSKR